MQALPLSLKLAGQPCLVVGGGEVARRKLEPLVAVGAELVVVAKEVSPGVRELCESHGARIEERPFAPDDVAGRLFVIAATNDAETNEAVSRACAQRRVLVNCVDDGERSTALFPAIVDRGSVTVAISTGGASPTLARRLRERIETVVPSAAGDLADYLRSRRERIRAALPDLRHRQRFWDLAMDSELATLAQRGDIPAADRVLDAALNAPLAAGFVSLVGAGPGDADLLTLKALRCLQRADVICHDRLVSADVLARCRRDAERVDVGREPFGGGVGSGQRQARIIERLVEGAAQGLRMVRLKGGDPLVFGRGGEEIEALARRNVAFEVVPGVSAAQGCAAVAGIPLTHRDWADSVCFVTARRHGGEVRMDWAALAGTVRQTLVVYMGLDALDGVCEGLMAHGMAAETPAATVLRGTRADERIVVGTLGDLAAKVRACGGKGPATTIVGRVVSFAAASLGREA